MFHQSLPSTWRQRVDFNNRRPIITFAQKSGPSIRAATNNTNDLKYTLYENYVLFSTML
jgi:hypothetical protein